MKTFSQKLAVALLLTAFFLACNKNENSIIKQDELATTTNGPKNQKNFIFIESNAIGPNTILTYRQNPNGTLDYLATTASGGNGTGTALGSHGALQLSADNRWLFAVNAGSNSISSFAIDQNGGLTLVATVSSNGFLPISLTVRGNTLYVVNSASARISGFTIGSDGSLNLISGSTQALSSEFAKPAQISFSPLSNYSVNNYLLVTEKATNKITKFPLNGDVAGPGSSITSCNTTPVGVGFADNYAIISQAAGGATNASTVALYMGGTNLISGPVHAAQTSASSIAMTNDGKYLYVSNTGCNTLSLFAVDRYGIVTTVSEVAAKTGVGPSDLVLSSDNFYLYVININSHSISEFKKGNNTNLQSIGEVTGLPPFATGLVAL